MWLETVAAKAFEVNTPHLIMGQKRLYEHKLLVLLEEKPIQIG